MSMSQGGGSYPVRLEPFPIRGFDFNNHSMSILFQFQSYVHPPALAFPLSGRFKFSGRIDPAVPARPFPFFELTTTLYTINEVAEGFVFFHKAFRYQDSSILLHTHEK